MNPSIEDHFGHLHRVQGRPFPDLVAHHPERKSILEHEILPAAAHPALTPGRRLEPRWKLSPAAPAHAPHVPRPS